MLKTRERSTLGSGFSARFRRDRRGVAAIEFAFIAPVMVVLYLGLSELCTVMMADRRASHADSAIGDLAAQAKSLHDSDSADIFKAANTVLSPFDATELELRLTSVIISPSKVAKVEWSDLKAADPNDLRTAAQKELVALTCDKVVPNFPPELATTPGDNVIMAEAVYKYASPVSFRTQGVLKFRPRYFMRPRYAKVSRYYGANATPVACPIT